MRRHPVRLIPARARSRAASTVEQFRVELQPPQRVVPHAFETPAERPERLRSGAVVPMLPVTAHADQTGAGQRLQLQGHCPKRDIGHGGVNRAGRQFLAPDEAEDFLPARRGQDGEHGGVHGITLD